MTDLWTMAGEEAERDEAEHKLALARVACANYWPILASANTQDSYDHAKALITEGIIAAVASVAISPADQAVLASKVMDSFDQDWEAHLIAQGAFSRQHYEAIAQALHDYQAKNAGGGVIPGLAEHWSDKLASTSALFNKERFVHAATQGNQKGSSMDMPLLTQDHYEAIADAIASSPTRHRAALATHFAKVLSGSNVKFKPDIFMRRANPTGQQQGRGEGGSMANPGTGHERSRAHTVAASKQASVIPPLDHPRHVTYTKTYSTTDREDGAVKRVSEDRKGTLTHASPSAGAILDHATGEIGTYPLSAIRLTHSGEPVGPHNLPTVRQQMGRSTMATRTAVVEDAPGYVNDHPFGLPPEPLPNEAPELEAEIDAWEGADREQRVNMGNGIGVADDSSGPNVEGPGQNQGIDPLLHASALDIEAGLEPGDYRLDAFGALVLVRNQTQAVRHTAPGGGEHAPYYVKREGDKYKVVNRNGDVKGTFNTKEEARGQQKALYANVPGASEEAEKRHGEEPKETKEGSRHTARELRCTKCKAEMTGGSKGGRDSNSGGNTVDWGSCPKGGSHTPEWGPDKEASLQLTALQRQAVAVARHLVDGMPAGVEHHAVAKAMYMRAKGFDLDEAETDLVVNAALGRVNERLDFPKQAIVGYPPGYTDEPHMQAHPEIRRMMGRVHVGTPDDEVANMGAQWAESKGARPGDSTHAQAISDALAVHHYNQDEYADVMNHSTWPRGQSSPEADPNQQRLFAKRHTAEGVSEDKRDRAEKSGDTLPGTDKFPITNRTDLENAKHDIGRTTEPHDKVVNYINRKADELGAPKVGEEKESSLRRLWAKLTGRTAQGGNPMTPGANPFDPTQDVSASQTDTNPDMGAAAGGGGMMDPSTQPPDEIPGQTIPGSATGTAASSKPRTKPSENPNAPNKPQPMQPQGMPMVMPGQMMTGMPMMSNKARVIIAASILENNPGLTDDEALHLATRTIERYPHVVKEAYGGSDYPFGEEGRTYASCPQCGVAAFDDRSGHCHNCGFVNGSGQSGYDPLTGPTTIRPGQADLRNPGTR